MRGVKKVSSEELYAAVCEAKERGMNKTQLRLELQGRDMGVSQARLDGAWQRWIDERLNQGDENDWPESPTCRCPALGPSPHEPHKYSFGGA